MDFVNRAGETDPGAVLRRRLKDWQEGAAARQSNIPKGLSVYRQIDESLIEPVTLSPDGRYLTSGAMDGNVRLWDTEKVEEITALPEHTKPIASVAWSSNGLLASGSRDTLICIWEPEKAELLHTLKGHSRTVWTLSWSPDGAWLASGGEDKSIRIWDTKTGVQRSLFLGHPRTVRYLAWSHDGRFLASGDDGGQIRIWDTQTGISSYAIAAHLDRVRALAWSPKEEGLLVSSGDDAIIRVWDTEKGRQIHRLEHHTNQVTDIVFSPDSQILASQSVANGAEVCFWRTDSWELLAAFPINPFKNSAPFACIKTASSLPLLLTGGDTQEQMLLWEMDVEVLLQGITPTVRYTNAKVVLAGDTGVGKTGLFRALLGKNFVRTESTHARDVRLFAKEEVSLNAAGKPEEKGKVRERREILLWDLAGQPGYRPIHQLRLSEVTVGVVVFDSRHEINPFVGVYYWDRALRQAHNVSKQSTLPLTKLLVAARIDRGGIPVSRERINEVVQELGFEHYIEASAKEGRNIEQLRQTIIEAIAWDALPSVTSNTLFEAIKDLLLNERQKVLASQGRGTGHILVRIDDLYKILLNSAKFGPHFHSEELRAQFERSVALVEARGLITRLRIADDVLLQPELLDVYASALVNNVLYEPDEQGSISLARVKKRQFRMPSKGYERAREENVFIQNEADERRVLLAVIEDLLRHELTMLERTSTEAYLTFPSRVTRSLYALATLEGKALTFDFEGAIQNIYATLIVRLAHSGVFRRGELWRDSATFTSGVGGLYGLFLETLDEGRGRLTLFFDVEASLAQRFQFEDYVEAHLQRWAIPSSIRRERVFTCSNPQCKEPVQFSTVLKRRQRGYNWLSCPNCETRIDIIEQERPTTIPSLVLEMDASADRQRNLDILHATRPEEIELNKALGKNLSYYDVFLCASPGDTSAAAQLGDQLLEKNILPWFAEWELQPGQQWDEVLKSQIDSIGAVAVCVGEGGPAPWEDPLVDHLLRTFANDRRIIPVLLPELEHLPTLPDYIKETYIDLRLAEPDPLMTLSERIKYS